MVPAQNPAHQHHALHAQGLALLRSTRHTQGHVIATGKSQHGNTNAAPSGGQLEREVTSACRAAHGHCMPSGFREYESNRRQPRKVCTCTANPHIGSLAPAAYSKNMHTNDLAQDCTHGTNSRHKELAHAAASSNSSFSPQRRLCRCWRPRCCCRCRRCHRWAWRTAQ